MARRPASSRSRAAAPDWRTLAAELAEARAQQTATTEVLQVINSSPGDLAPVFDVMLERAMRLCEATGGALRSYHGDEFRIAAIRGMPEAFTAATHIRRPPPATALGRIERGEPVVHIADLTDPAEPVPDPESRREMVELGGIRTALWVALRKDEALLGTFVLYRDRVQPFTDKQIALVENFAQQAVIAMENARLLTETREALEQQTATTDVLQVINSSPGDLAPVWEAILEKATRLCDAPGAILWAYEGDHFAPAASYGVSEAFATFLRQGDYDWPSLALNAIAEGKPFHHNLDLATGPGYVSGANRLSVAVVDLAGAHTGLLVPLRKDDRLLGAIRIFRHEVRPFSDKQIALLQNFAAQAVIAMENARLLTETRERSEELARERDVAEAARQEADAANQAKSTFLATMSHEIRTPMNGVLGMIEVLDRQGLDERQRRVVATMRGSADALLRIIDDVLDFSKIEAGRLDIEATDFSLSALVAGAIDTLRPQALAKGLALDAEIAPGSDDALVGDPTRVRQILFNLVGNALKFTERGGVRVRVATAPLGGGRSRVTIAVADTGIGIDAAHQARLFDPFAQADSSTTRRYGGSGLGLSIVRRLAQLMGGDVAIVSAPGQGSTFTATLVLDAAPAAAWAAPEPAVRVEAAAYSPSGATLLVVDDHPVNREVLVQQLDLLGLAADTASDGIEALTAWAPGRYAAVLADLHMPGMDGYELTRRLRAAEAEQAAPRTPIVAVTANALRGEAERCLAAGMDGFVAKPVALDVLTAELARWLPELRRSDAAGGVEPIADAAFDPARLTRLFGDDRDRVARLVEEFAKTAKRDVAALRKAATAAAMAEMAHRLKGAARTVGAPRLAAGAERVEAAGRKGDHAAARREAVGIAALLAEALTAGRAAFAAEALPPTRQSAAGTKR